LLWAWYCFSYSSIYQNKCLNLLKDQYMSPKMDSWIFLVQDLVQYITYWDLDYKLLLAFIYRSRFSTFIGCWRMCRSWKTVGTTRLCSTYPSSHCQFLPGTSLTFLCSLYRVLEYTATGLLLLRIASLIQLWLLPSAL
jgi:hypothetical protein